MRLPRPIELILDAGAWVADDVATNSYGVGATEDEALLDLVASLQWLESDLIATGDKTEHALLERTKAMLAVLA